MCGAGISGHRRPGGSGTQLCTNCAALGCLNSIRLSFFVYKVAFITGLTGQHCCLDQTRRCVRVLDGVPECLAHKTSGLTRLCLRTKCRPLLVPQSLHLVTSPPSVRDTLKEEAYRSGVSRAFFNHQKSIIPCSHGACTGCATLPCLGVYAGPLMRDARFLLNGPSILLHISWFCGAGNRHEAASPCARMSEVSL